MKLRAAHERFCDSVRAFVKAEIAPRVDACGAARTFPREFCRRVALFEHQVTRHKPTDMKTRLASTQSLLHAMVARLEVGDTDTDRVGELRLLENHAMQTTQWCADAATQPLGSMGCMRGTRSERICREVKVMMIGNGAEELMKELAARRLGA